MHTTAVWKALVILYLKILKRTDEKIYKELRVPGYEV